MAAESRQERAPPTTSPRGRGQNRGGATAEGGAGRQHAKPGALGRGAPGELRGRPASAPQVPRSVQRALCAACRPSRSVQEPSGEGGERELSSREDGRGSNQLLPTDLSAAEPRGAATRGRPRWPGCAKPPEHRPSPALEHGLRRGLCFYYWGLFDGHAGGGAAEMASRLLHRHIREQLKDLVEILQDPSPPPLCLPSTPGAPGSSDPSHLVGPQSCWSSQKEVTHESLVVGAIENAFQFMDEQMARERHGHQVEGGCCALVVVYLLGKVYVANAGDSRAIIVRNGEVIPMSREFTPETERQRLQLLGFLKPELLGGEFTHLEFPRRIQPKELGQRMLYRDQNMTGWAYKKIELEDLRFPLVCGEGKKARVMATIGVTRGLGDHNLKVCSSTLPIKPFLSCFPEVRVYDLTQYEHCPDDVLVLGTDGLWDVTSDCEVAATVDRVLSAYEPNDPSRYTALAQALVLGARGTPRDRGWRLPNNKLGSGDDISVFVIPLGGPGSYS
uniref:Protein phosphatase, Mg2+/Mn2+ dependent 1J n=1 Tax=Suricata suricatta TaxID=37032 RepID=A0A673VJ91_SURSU